MSGGKSGRSGRAKLWCKWTGCNFSTYPAKTMAEHEAKVHQWCEICQRYIWARYFSPRHGGPHQPVRAWHRPQGGSEPLTPD